MNAAFATDSALGFAMQELRLGQGLAAVVVTVGAVVVTLGNEVR